MTADPFDPNADWPDSDATIDSPLSSTMEENRDVMEAIRLLEAALPRIDDPVGIYIALYDMFTDLEHMSEAGAALIRGAQLVRKGSHPELAYFLYKHLELFAQLLPEAQSVYENLSDFIATGAAEMGVQTLHLDQRKIYQHDLIPELLLAQHLHRARKISDQEYYIILHDLCWYSPTPPTNPRTVLYVLEDRELPHRDAAIEFLAHDSGVAYIDLDLIDADPEAAEILPPDFVRIRGACPFGFMGGEPLIAVLNPFNLQLRDDVMLQMDGEAHYFLTNAKAYHAKLQALAYLTP